jgi:hypothetical protein
LIQFFAQSHQKKKQKQRNKAQDRVFLLTRSCPSPTQKILRPLSAKLGEIGKIPTQNSAMLSALFLKPELKLTQRFLPCELSLLASFGATIPHHSPVL